MVVRAACSLAAADIDGALALVQESGWNQVAADWQLFIDLGQALKLPDELGAVAATAAILPYRRFGWISMVLVRGTHRRRGIATALLRQCVDELQSRGLVPMLDATPAGREVYRRIGFTDGWALTRWRRVGGATKTTAPQDARVRPLRDDDLPAIALLDEHAFGAQRIELLRKLAARSRGFACVAEKGGRIAGFLLGRDGRVATQAGPIVADEPALAQALLAHAAARVEGQLLVDALDREDGLAPVLAASGFQVERGYTRMAQGPWPGFGDASRTFAIAGPELG
jgi:ribosomal protein S18 acetylase RimI-like enzyme